MFQFCAGFVFIAAFACSDGASLPADWEEYVPPGSPRVSQPTNNSLFQGDLDINKEEAANAVQGDLRWVDGIVPFEIDPAFTKPEKELIRKMMDSIKSMSCLEFKPRQSETDYIYFKPSPFCSSKLGRFGGKQFLNLNQIGCMEPGIIVHEILHALGFLHEQARPDRDRYVKIILDNIDPGNRDQFDIKSRADILGTPYDYGSIMHYGMFDFAKNPMQPTLLPARKGVREPIGQRDGLSRTDILRINLFYDCPPPKSSEAITFKPPTSATTTLVTRAPTTPSTTVPQTTKDLRTMVMLTPEEILQLQRLRDVAAHKS